MELEKAKMKANMVRRKTEVGFNLFRGSEISFNKHKTNNSGGDLSAFNSARLPI